MVLLESPSPAKIQKPAMRAFLFWPREVSRLRGLRGGFEGNRLQAIPRPAACRRIPLSPPNTKARTRGLFCLAQRSKPPARLTRGFEGNRLQA